MQNLSAAPRLEANSSALSRAPALRGDVARRTVMVAALLPAGWHAWLLLHLFRFQVPFPMDLEWMEGGEIYHAWRFAHGEAIYASPEQGFVPYPYPPLHFVVLALVGRIAGFGYAPARLVSVAFFLLGALLLAREVARRAGTGLEGFAFGAVALATIGTTVPTVIGWYALVRNDSMAIALPILAAVLASSRQMTPTRVMGIAMTMAAAIYTKQTGVFFCAWIIVFLFIHNRRAAIATTLAFGVLTLCTFVALQIGTHGWFMTYLLLQRHHAFLSDRVPLGAWELFKSAPYMAAVPMAAAYLAGRGKLSARSALWVGMVLAAFPAALLPYAKAGGCQNNLIPVALLGGPTSILVALDLVDLSSVRGWLVSVGRSGAAGFFAVVAMRGSYDPTWFVPRSTVTADAQRLNAWVRSLPGEVLAVSHPMLALLNGKTTAQIHAMPLRDAYDGKVSGSRLAAWMREHRADWAIVDQDAIAPGLLPALARYYAPAGRVPFDVPMTMATGVNPTTLYQRKPDHLRSRVVFDFESTYEGWELSGEAFAQGPTGEQRDCQQTIVGLEGLRLANSYGDRTGDGATGRALSPPFTLDRPRMSLLVGGGSGPAVRVELLVDGASILTASGRRSEEMDSIEWDVSAWKERTARLAIVDEDTTGWGHVLVDHVELYD
ncbi:MAG: glycosyltransferase family 39 protein [Myxococcota bacterium]|nr:glycosyltransferase family 39 protein [Myxococcota bacterium]